MNDPQFTVGSVTFAPRKMGERQMPVRVPFKPLSEATLRMVAKVDQEEIDNEEETLP